MTIAAFIVRGIGPGATIPLHVTGGLEIGAPPSGLTGIKIGATTVSKIYIGTTEISKVYVGSTQVWG